jgi:hypothetical protein
MPHLPASLYGLMLKKARELTRSLGYRCAAGYLRNRNVSFEVAYEALFNRAPTR